MRLVNTLVGAPWRRAETGGHFVKLTEPGVVINHGPGRFLLIRRLNLFGFLGRDLQSYRAELNTETGIGLSRVPDAPTAYRINWCGNPALRRVVRKRTKGC